MRLPITILRACDLPTPKNDHSRTRFKGDERTAMHRRHSAAWLREESDTPPALPLVITLTRIGNHVDDDNIRGVFSAIRDGICDYLGLKSDSTSLITWRYEQQPGTTMPGVPYRTFAHIRVEARR